MGHLLSQTNTHPHMVQPILKSASTVQSAKLLRHDLTIERWTEVALPQPTTKTTKTVSPCTKDLRTRYYYRLTKSNGTLPTAK